MVLRDGGVEGERVAGPLGRAAQVPHGVLRAAEGRGHGVVVGELGEALGVRRARERLQRLRQAAVQPQATWGGEPAVQRLAHECV